MYNIEKMVVFQAADKSGKILADSRETASEARRRAVLKSLGMKAFKPREWPEIQRKFLEKVGPMRIVKQTSYRAHGDGKPIAEPREIMADAKADVDKAIKDKAPKTGRAGHPTAQAPKEGDS